jgi:hypothetical protein
MTTGRLPFIGTSIALSAPRMARWLGRRMLGRPLVNLELHGIDLLDADEDGLQWLRPHQPDLKRSGRAKLLSLSAAVGALRDGGCELVTLHEAAHRIDL